MKTTRIAAAALLLAAPLAVACEATTSAELPATIELEEHWVEPTIAPLTSPPPAPRSGAPDDELRPVPPPRVQDDGCSVPTGVAHRGGAAGDYTENTLLAYAHVWAWGVNEWETDVRWDAAGVPVLMHDATIDRTTNGTGSVTTHTWSTSAVRTDDGQELADQTLANIADLAAARGATLAIEPKVVPTAAQAAAVLAIVNTNGLHDRVLLNSFSAANLAPFKALDPTLTYGLVASTAVDPATAAAVGPILNVSSAALTRQRVDDYHAAGLQVYAWTLDAPSQWAPQRTWEIDRYVTNRAKDFRAWRDWVCLGDRWEGDY